MTDTPDPLAAIETLLDALRMGESRYSTIRNLDQDLRTALAEARQAVDALVAERDGLINYWAKAASNALYDMKTERKRAEKAEAERDRLREEVMGHRMMDWPAEAHRLKAERDAAREALARVEALIQEAAQWVTYADASRDIVEVFSDAWMHATILRGLAALAQPATDEEAGQ